MFPAITVAQLTIADIRKEVSKRRQITAVDVRQNLSNSCNSQIRYLRRINQLTFSFDYRIFISSWNLSVNIPQFGQLFPPELDFD